MTASGIPVLASASPRRAALLAGAGVPFEPGPAPDVDETPPAGAGPGAAAEALARRKAEAAARLVPGRLVLAADTLAWLDGAPLGKPADAAEAAVFLRRLSARWHAIVTGVALAVPGRGGRAPAVWADHRTTRVRFRTLSAAEIAAYVAGGEPLGKAGAYAIQGGASAFVERLEGDRDTVVGLPVRAVRALLARALEEEAGAGR